MKAIYAGLVADVDLANIKSYQYLCKKQPYELQYYIPVTKLSDVQVYINFGSVKPLDTMVIQLISLCTPSIIDSIEPCHYKVGVDPDGNYYGVFQFADYPGLTQFAIAFTVEMSNFTTRVYITEGYAIDDCADIEKVEACFPDLQDDIGFDINGIYFGSTMNPTDSFGNTDLRYQHYAFLRKCKVFEDSPKATFSSNLRRNFKTSLERIYELRSELVPSWYKDYLLAIYARGFIKVNGTTYRVTDLALEAVDDDDVTWKPNCKLKIEQHLYYGCADETCVDCCSPCNVSAVAVTTPCCSPEVTEATAVPLIDPDEAILTFTNYAAGAFHFTLDVAIPSTDVVISDATVQGFLTTDCSTAFSQSDNITANPVTITAGTTSAFNDGDTPMDCMIESWVKVDSIIVNGVLKHDGETITVGGTLVTIVIDTTCNSPYAC